MIYFYLGLSSIAVLVLHGVSFGWIQYNKDNSFHTITNLWLRDPFEKVVLVEQNQDCPDGTSTESMTFYYGGTSGLCACELSPKDTYISTNSNDRYLQYSGSVLECSQQYCSADYTSVQKYPPIDSKNLDTFFYDKNKKEKFKVCASRIPGYSFAKKAPLQNKCGSNEKYCQFANNGKVGFDIDHGYCIPDDRECQFVAVQLGDYSKKLTSQLPLVDLDTSSYASGMYNVLNYQTIVERDLLKMNDIDYPPYYDSFLNNNYFIWTKHMPRVKLRCRSQLQDELSSYLGPNGVYKVSLALLVFSILSCIIQFFFSGIGDIIDMTACDKSGCKGYCEVKRVNTKNSSLKNILFIMKPSLLFLIIILNIVMIRCYIMMINYVEFMIDDGCLDQYVATAIGYNEIYSTNLFNSGLTYASLAISSIAFIFDQNFYYLIKTIFMIIFCQKKISCKRPPKQETISKTSPEMNSLKQNAQAIPDIENGLKTQVQNTQAESAPYISTLTQIIKPNLQKDDLNKEELKEENTKEVECYTYQAGVKLETINAPKQVIFHARSVSSQDINEKEKKQFDKPQIAQKSNSVNKQEDDEIKLSKKEKKRLKKLEKEKKKKEKNNQQGVKKQSKIIISGKVIFRNNGIDRQDEKIQNKQGKGFEKYKEGGFDSFSSFDQKEDRESMQNNDINIKRFRSFENISVKKEEIKFNNDIFSINDDDNKHKDDNFKVIKQENKNNIDLFGSNNKAAQQDKEFMFNNEFMQESEKPIQFFKKKTNEVVQPPEAPQPPEQSEQLNNSILQLDDF